MSSLPPDYPLNDSTPLASSKTKRDVLGEVTVGLKLATAAVGLIIAVVAGYYALTSRMAMAEEKQTVLDARVAVVEAQRNAELTVITNIDKRLSLLHCKIDPVNGCNSTP